MTNPSGRGLSEGAAVVVASLVMVLGLTGVMVWQVRTADPVVFAESGPDPEVEALQAERDGLESSVKKAASEAAVLRDEVGKLKGRIRDVEAERLDAKARGELAAESSRNQVRELEDEVARVRKQAQDAVSRAKALEAQVEVLSDATVEAAGSSEMPRPVASVADGVSDRVLTSVRVVDSNEELNYVVLDAGTQDGVRPGMIFHVMDGDTVAAKLRTMDVRDSLSGAAVDELVSGAFPTENDRAVLRQYADR